MQNILVVEDDYDLNQAICYSLKKSGYGVYGVTFKRSSGHLPDSQGYGGGCSGRIRIRSRRLRYKTIFDEDFT